MHTLANPGVILDTRHAIVLVGKTVDGRVL
jgi:hypothetical protein